jgi:beta-galactosidase/beta-glucuronidase
MGRIGLRRGRGWGALAFASVAVLATAATAGPRAYGPYNYDLSPGGAEVARPLADWGGASSVPANAAFTLYGWVSPAKLPAGRALIAGIGAPASGGRFLALDHGRLALWTPAGEVAATAPLSAGGWRFVAAVCDAGRVRLYLDGAEVANGALSVGATPAVVRLAPRQIEGLADFGGRLAGFTAEPGARSAADIAALYAERPDFSVVVLDTNAPNWPVQHRARLGLTEPQDAWTLPKSRAPFGTPTAKPAYDGPALTSAGHEAWALPKWRLIAADKAGGGGEALSKPGWDVHAWYPATVPGTALTTLVDRGVYPDPAYDLNNMAIPESLARQDWWYRAEFTPPAAVQGRRQILTFKGINYQAEVWLNGERLGEVKGAFIRGRFDVTGKLKPGQANGLAIHVFPPPHPGIAHEQSMTAGSGQNGGIQALDGPTFIATEGWDWIPGVRDRNTGLWQDVVLSASGQVRLGDSQVVTSLPKADNSEADVVIDAPIENQADHPLRTTVTAAFDDVSVSKTVTAAPGETVVKFTPAEFPALAVRHPKLWWPNGYGAPALHKLHLAASVDGVESDEADTRFGMRQVTYELSLMDPEGELRRVEIDPTKARALGESIVDGSHAGIRLSKDGWVASLTKQGESSPAVRALPPTPLSPYLVIKVNGARIAARGGSWGMDDFMKRVSREKLEPFFRLHRDAGINIIRNWVGQNTEDAFFDLADEYGLLVVNDFWASTQDSNLEPEDVPLFLNNARDVISRYRNHPSIALWVGRNEGVPQPILNEGLEKLVQDLDGTRYYSGSSNRVNLQASGPYKYEEPASYFTTYSKGFAVEVGTPSFPTKEAFEAAIAKPDLWPIGDAWAYHDWHQDGSGPTQVFMEAMTAKLGAPKDFDDFARKAQLLEYESHRAIFEGMNAELWTKTSGRMLWMTQPAWPSTNWQIMSHDYDTHAAYYGVKSAAEKVHVQLRLPDHRIELVNNELQPLSGVKVRARVVGLDGRLLADRRFGALAAPADDVVQGPMLGADDLIARTGAVVVELEATGRDGALLSRNVYWLAKDAEGSRKLADMTPQTVTLSAAASSRGDEAHLSVTLTNTGHEPALTNKLTLLDAQGRRILPAYYSDNYVSLLPGERRVIDIAYPASAGQGAPHVTLRGWNTVPAEAQPAPAR